MLLKLMGLFIYSFRMMKGLILLPILNLGRNIAKFFNPQAAIVKLIQGIQKKLQSILKLKPEKKGDYVELKYHYVAKILFLLVPLVMVGAVLGYFLYLQPWLVSKFFTADFYDDNKNLPTYNGKVNVVSRESNRIVFSGRLENGFRVEYGKKFKPDGTLIYEGNFVNDFYEGFGKEYDDGGNLIYEGQFLGGIREGTGTEYHADTHSISYRGGFSAAQYNGEGMTYFKNGMVEYKGTFVAGEKNGQGSQYAQNGKLIYKGSFASGEWSGQGTQYNEDGSILYAGSFAGGKPNGQGALYDKIGKVSQEGSFKNGLLSGSGLQYYNGTQEYYEGHFMNGKPHGDGKLFVNGVKRYEGEFFNGKPQGEGKLFTRTGTPITQGPFINGDFIYEELLGKEAKDLSKNFPQKAETLRFENDFALLPEGTGSAFLLNYANMDKTTAIHDIILWENENSAFSLLTIKGVTKAAIIAAMGEPEGEYKVTAGLHLSSILSAKGVPGIAENASLVDTLVLKDGNEYHFYFGDGGNRFVALRITAVMGVQDTKGIAEVKSR